MKLNLNSLSDRAGWEKAGVKLPTYSVEAMRDATAKQPRWVHFGAGNIFRAYIARLQNTLLCEGLTESGIVAADTSSVDAVSAVYTPYDNLSMLVSLYGDGSIKKEIIASIAEAFRVNEQNSVHLTEIFCNPSLQIVSFTITEKGYGITDASGEYLPYVLSDIERGPRPVGSVMCVATALLLKRFESCNSPVAFVSMDNCSHNGEKLAASINTIAREWVERGFAPAEFLDYISRSVSFPWSMIDKITPRPDMNVADELAKAGIEGMTPVPFEHGAMTAPFVNAEAAEYLVIEDDFPAGRPPLERAGVFMTDRDTVNKTERMKVTTCLNPLHTALAVYGCLLGYEHIYDEISDKELNRLIRLIGITEGLPVVTNPGILNPTDFLNEVLNERLPNPFMPDTPQRIACDTSQKVGIRYGETIKSYLASDSLEVGSLTGIPLAIAGWFRYLLGEDDLLRPMTLSSDPRLEELQAAVSGIKVGDKSSYRGQLRPLLADATLFASDLTKTPLADKIEEMFISMLEGSGAVRSTLTRLLG